jgi:uncharacterized protein
MQIKQIFEKQNATAAGVLGAAFIIIAIIGGIFLSNLRSSGNVLTSTGSAKTSVTSDSAKFSGSVIAYGAQYELPTRYKELEASTEKVKAYLLASGVTEEELVISPITQFEQYDYNNSGGPKQFQLSQMVSVNSTDVEKVTKISNGVADIAKSGVLFQTNGAQYFYSKLADLRVSLLGEAVKDAKARAREIAKASGSNVGKLKSATSGVVQVLAPNSIDTSDYGTYDTSTVEKEVMVTVRATFIIK